MPGTKRKDAANHGGGQLAKQARADSAAGATLTHTELYARYHRAEAALRVEQVARTSAEATLGMVVDKAQSAFPRYQECSERLQAALNANASLSDRMAAAQAQVADKEQELSRMAVEVRVLRQLLDESGGVGGGAAAPSSDAAPSARLLAELKEQLLTVKVSSEELAASAASAAERTLRAALEKGSAGRADASAAGGGADGATAAAELAEKLKASEEALEKMRKAARSWKSKFEQAKQAAAAAQAAPAAAEPPAARGA